MIKTLGTLALVVAAASAEESPKQKLRGVDKEVKAQEPTKKFFSLPKDDVVKSRRKPLDADGKVKTLELTKRADGSIRENNDIRQKLVASGKLPAERSPPPNPKKNPAADATTPATDATTPATDAATPATDATTPVVISGNGTTPSGDSAPWVPYDNNWRAYGGYEKGYLIEFTRTNTDCSGKVLSIAGLHTGSSTFDFERFYERAWHAHKHRVDAYDFVFPPYVEKGDSYFYEMNFLIEPDGFFGYNNYFGMGGPQCSHWPDGDEGGYIPFSQRFLDHGGYYYGHKYSKGSFSKAVSSQYSGAYRLYYDSLSSCELGYEPFQFYATLIKGECYFDPSAYNLDVSDNDVDPEDHKAWFKVLGYDVDDQSIKYSIHRSDDCESKDPYRKPKVHTATYTDLHIATGDYAEQDVQRLDSGCYWNGPHLRQENSGGWWNFRGQDDDDNDDQGFDKSFSGIGWVRNVVF